MGADDRDIFVDEATGLTLDRPNYLALRNSVMRSGDTLVITSLDRLSRRKEDIKAELKFFKENNIRLIVLDIPTTSIPIIEGQEWIIDMVNNIMFEVIASLAEQERELNHQRQAEGIEVAKANEVKFGRPIVEKPENWEKVIKQVDSCEITAVEAMRILNLKKTTYYKLRKLYPVS